MGRVAGAFGPSGGVLGGIAEIGNAVLVNALLMKSILSLPAGTAGSVTEVNL